MTRQPCGNLSTSSDESGPTLSKASTSDQAISWTISAPAISISESGNEAARPASDSTTTECPCSRRRAMVSGVAATRCSAV